MRLTNRITWQIFVGISISLSLAAVVDATDSNLEGAPPPQSHTYDAAATATTDTSTNDEGGKTTTMNMNRYRRRHNYNYNSTRQSPSLHEYEHENEHERQNKSGSNYREYHSGSRSRSYHGSPAEKRRLQSLSAGYENESARIIEDNNIEDEDPSIVDRLLWRKKVKAKSLGYHAIKLETLNAGDIAWKGERIQPLATKKKGKGLAETEGKGKGSKSTKTTKKSNKSPKSPKGVVRCNTNNGKGGAKKGKGHNYNYYNDPTASPTNSAMPSSSPSCSPQPSLEHSNVPSNLPSLVLSDVPSSIPSLGLSDVPSVVPSNLPSVMASEEPSVSQEPTVSPTNMESEVPSSNPTEDDFDLDVCDTYSVEWARDLRESNKCIDATERMYSGQIKCILGTKLADECPKRCDICETCLSSLDEMFCKDTFPPTPSPTVRPTIDPTSAPSAGPTSVPSMVHSVNPTSAPTSRPTRVHSNLPSSVPSGSPTALPTIKYSSVPTSMPTSGPTRVTSRNPTGSPSNRPTSQPTRVPSDKPSIAHSIMPSATFSASPNVAHSILPTSSPTSSPTNAPSVYHSVGPTASPTPDDFDIDVCETYEIEWSRDYRDTGRCIDARERLMNHEIKCTSTPLVELCPEKCDICQTCLGEDLVDYCDGRPSATPTSAPTPIISSIPTRLPTTRPSLYPTGSRPTISPTLKPSQVLSESPTGLSSDSPSESPSMPPFSFDISNCESYTDGWMRDVLVDAYCSSAETLILEGKIDCGTDICPDGCTPCFFCLDSLGCKPQGSRSPTTTPSESVRPTLRPSKLRSDSPSLSQKPTVLRTLTPSQSMIPSSRPSFRPTQKYYFDLEDCDAYSPGWLSEVILYGECKSAQELIDLGSIECDIDNCPLDCGICDFCLKELGCVQGGLAPSEMPSSISLSEPSLAPSELFDISECSSYSTSWLFDLAETCKGNNGCMCKNAQAKIDDGSITCGVDVCPDGCVTCSNCLYDILDCKP